MLQYSQDGGLTWYAVGEVSDSAALLLSADAQNRLRFVPHPGFVGTIDNVFTFRGWDGTTGIVGMSGQYFDASSNGGSTAFSSATDAASIQVVVAPAAVVGRHLFYNESTFDGNNGAIDDSDDAAVASDKTPYTAGDGVIGPSAMSSYAYGINGIMVDVAGNAASYTLSDFGFKIGGGPATTRPPGWRRAEHARRAARQGRGRVGSRRNRLG